MPNKFPGGIGLNRSLWIYLPKRGATGGGELWIWRDFSLTTNTMAEMTIVKSDLLSCLINNDNDDDNIY